MSGYTGELTRHPLDKLIRVVSGGFPNLASWDKQELRDGFPRG
ncbi:unnamed protein product [marine sediment metagenome]|uniref:Uncharacterized protein n=1 Tax=marine sediment metagenome TaxID=412755 RepID=X1VKJ6_9ZZZZ